MAPKRSESPRNFIFIPTARFLLQPPKTQIRPRPSRICFRSRQSQSLTARVPFRRRIPRGDWRTWEVADQRFVDHRPDVFTYVSAPLDHDLIISGPLAAELFASTSGTDSDFVVKLIDVFPQDAQKHAWKPDEGPAPGQFAQSLDGYELPIAMEVRRGRYLESFEQPHALAANNPRDGTCRCGTTTTFS